MVIWVTGMSAAGKTTLCRALYDMIKPSMANLVLLEGETLRGVFGDDLGYEIHDRVEGVHRLRGLADTLTRQDIGIIAASVYLDDELSDWNRANLPGYFEVFLDASLETVQSRDPRGLYAKAVAGTMSNVVGFDIPLGQLSSPDMIVDVDHAPPAIETALKIVAEIPEIAGRLAEIPRPQ